MKNPFLEKYAVSLIAAAFYYAVKNSTYNIETSKLLEKYIDIPNETDIQDVFEFLREKKLIQENEVLSNSSIPSHFILLNDAILWAHETSKNFSSNS